MASKKRERCEGRRAATDAPELISVEVDDSAPSAGRLGSVPMPSAACATANGRPWAVLSPPPRPQAELIGYASCTNTREVPLLEEGRASLRKGLHRAGGIPRPASPLRPR